MLEKEYDLVVKRVSDQRPKNSVYFAFADTVTARSYTRPSAECHGWMGICFQAYPNAPLSEIILHVRTPRRNDFLEATWSLEVAPRNVLSNR